MREDLLKILETEYDHQRMMNEREEAARRARIRNEYPEIEQAAQAREELVFGSIRRILKQEPGKDDLPGKMEQMNRRIGELLRKNGLPEDYLAPVYRCPVCRDTGYTGEPIREPCACLKKAYQEKLRETIGLGKNRNETFENFDRNLIPDEIIGTTGVTQRDLAEDARKKCESWADRYPNVAQTGILLSGDSGLGKTFLMNCMAERLIERGQNVLMVSAYTFLQMARKSHFESETGVKELMEVPVLMLDDLGSEPLMQNVTIEQLFYLINERQIRGLATIISTNLTLPNLRERYTERITSRLTDRNRFMLILLAGRDLRKIERQNA